MTWHDVKLFVIGDSHAMFWKGHELVHEGPDSLPGVLTMHVPGALAWTLVKEDSRMQGREMTLAAVERAVAEGFQGWVMLSFGEIDLRHHVLRHALDIGLVAAVRDVADHYVKFVERLRQVHAKIALWAPPASHSEDVINSAWAPTFGADVERNFATLILTGILEERCALLDVPVLSLLPQLLRDDGKTHTDLLHDNVHLSQVLLPNALDLVEQKLGIVIDAPTSMLDFRPIELTRFTSTEKRRDDNKHWLCFELLSAMQLATVTLTYRFTQQLGEVTIGLSMDGKEFGYSRIELAEESQAGTALQLSVGAPARYVRICAAAGRLELEDVKIAVFATRLMSGQPGNGCTRALLIALQHSLLRRERRQHTLEYALQAGVV